MTRSKSGRPPCKSEQERKERRRAANRRSAQKSRYREMVLMDELQKTVAELTQRNSTLKEENDAFRRDLVILQKLMDQRRATASSGLNSATNHHHHQQQQQFLHQLPSSLKLAYGLGQQQQQPSGIIDLSGIPMDMQQQQPTTAQVANLNPDKIFPLDTDPKPISPLQSAAGVLTAETLYKTLSAQSSNTEI